MKPIILILMFFFMIQYGYGQQVQRSLRLIVVIDNDVCQDIIHGKFFIKDKNSNAIAEMPFTSWVGKLEMSAIDYKKLFNVKSQDTLYLTFENNNFQLDTTYLYEGK